VLLLSQSQVLEQPAVCCVLRHRRDRRLGASGGIGVVWSDSGCLWLAQKLMVAGNRNRRGDSQQEDRFVMAASNSMVAPRRLGGMRRERAREDGGQRARGTTGCAGNATSSYLQHACIRPLETWVSLGCSRMNHLIFPRATGRVVVHATCDARCPLSKGRIRRKHFLNTDECNLTAELMHSIMISID
jgi:hypothetical protein